MSVSIESKVENQEMDYADVFSKSRSRIDTSVEKIRRVVSSGQDSLQASTNDGEQRVKLLLEADAVSVEVTPVDQTGNESETWIVIEGAGVHRLVTDPKTGEPLMQELTGESLEGCNELQRIEQAVAACLSTTPDESSDW